MVKFIKHDIPECEQINTPEGRRYKTPEGKLYPSVTTVLGSIPDPELEAWRAAVGVDKANEIGRKAAKRGTKIHTWCECYIKQIGFGIAPHDHEAGQMFFNMCPELNKFEEVHALEQRLWSDSLQVAGSVDCIAKVDGKMTIVDFKTSTNPKTADMIPGYFMQCSAYAQCWWERTGIAINKIRIIMTTQDDGVLIFDEQVKNWLPKFIEIRKKMSVLL